jgi:hypothetical protein
MGAFHKLIQVVTDPLKAHQEGGVEAAIGLDQKARPPFADQSPRQLIRRQSRPAGRLGELVMLRRCEAEDDLPAVPVFVFRRSRHGFSKTIPATRGRGGVVIDKTAALPGDSTGAEPL